MISVNEAKKKLDKSAIRGRKKTVSLLKSLNYILAEDLYSLIDVPSFNNSAMDGYAMSFDGTQNSWKVISTIQAGDIQTPKIAANEAARIFTGAKMPAGADTVIPQELIEKDAENNSVHYLQNSIEKGANVRLKGSQCKKGTKILSKGSKVTPGAIALIASVGIKEVNIFSPPEVAFIVTGNELKEVGEPLAEGEIYNSNGPLLEASLRQVGIENIVALRAEDDQQALQQSIDESLKKYDIIILSGGISVGDYDFVKVCLEDAGVEELFYKIKQRPGKPMYSGKKANKRVFALPGNPASVLSCFYQYVHPCIRFWMGYENVWQPDLILPLTAEVKKKQGFTFFKKAFHDGKKVSILEGQQSFNLLPFAEANCLVELEEELDYFPEKYKVSVYNL
ncbi:molybdopterin molybdotransferase MoeA [Marivirga sp.]|uniref:molybdopterin molybdotransferase MoeA n=1 Tax=Marivirga sp. TaxID=2018662 RepID=UPI002D7FBE1A|nr:molybdopterin molybdotransferase MoeA [Marivirga sp.]HET8860933.1 molybdopterin molybdotransferase MoeA [Marivirga sp.]